MEKRNYLRLEIELLAFVSDVLTESNPNTDLPNQFVDDPKMDDYFG